MRAAYCGEPMSAPLPRFARAARAASALALAALMAGCAKVPVVGGKPQVTLRVTAAPNANSCGQDVGNSMAFRLIQVTDASGMTGTSLAQFWDREDKVLGPAFLSRHDGVVDPGQVTELKFERDEKARALVFVGSFCRPQSACWYAVRPLSKGATMKLAVDESCVRESRK